MRGKPKIEDQEVLAWRNIPAYAGKTRFRTPRLSCNQEHPRVCGENFIFVQHFCTILRTSPRMRGKLFSIIKKPIEFRNIPAYAGKTFVPASCAPVRKEHPRVCGENVPIDFVKQHVPRTSPRMRGKRFSLRLRMSLERNIPAYAGKTRANSIHTPLKPEHPRVCGENVPNRARTPTASGTSPRMRGKRLQCWTHRRSRRNIPAYAGKTAMASPHVSMKPEHPRVCGENRRGVNGLIAFSGTSPRMRGKPHRQNRIHVRGRNIPAYAGKTSTQGWVISGFSEHPRVCGENVAALNLKMKPIGTSPRMRGKLVSLNAYRGQLRNIPAYAGKTRWAPNPSKKWAEHPRVCGENEVWRAANKDGKGTSPRMRGKPNPARPTGTWGRNIPAYAGKTCTIVKVGPLPWEHPRVCGENSKLPGWGKLHFGTSPRMRGKPAKIGFSHRHFRNIPAYAGKTRLVPAGTPSQEEHPRVCGEN